MTDPKRARDVREGDVLPSGATVQRIHVSERGYTLYVRCPDGSTKRLRYAPQTILPGPDDRHPSRFEEGHPWNRKGRSTRANAQS